MLKHLPVTQPILLENETILTGLNIAYHQYGELLPNKKVLWVAHALTADSDVMQWWSGLFGNEKTFSEAKYCIICPNNLGSCYGTSVINNNDQPLQLTLRDMVQVHSLLATALSITTIEVAIGGSQGGQLLIEWNIQNPQLFKNVILLATNAKHSAWGIAFNEAQRMAILADNSTAKHSGLAAARAIAMLSYRSYYQMVTVQTDNDSLQFEKRKAVTYLQYQGKKLAKRFTWQSYLTLSYAMDSHDVARGRLSEADALNKITARVAVIGINHDILFPSCEQQHLANLISNATYYEIASDYGHDGFLTETVSIQKVIKQFLNF